MCRSAIFRFKGPVLELLVKTPTSRMETPTKIARKLTLLRLAFRSSVLSLHTFDSFPYQRFMKAPEKESPRATPKDGNIVTVQTTSLLSRFSLGFAIDCPHGMKV